MMTERVLMILSQVLGVARQRVTLEASPDTMTEWDSLKHMNLVLALEEAFEIRFTDAEIGEIVTVPRIVAALTKHGVAA
jgi:acyl carrier protein